MAPHTIFARALTGLIPTLNEVVMDIRGCWAGHLNVEVIAPISVEVPR